MGTQIGEVNINLRMSLAQFKTDVKDGADAASTATRKIADDVGSNIGEARGSIMLLSEEVGVHLPRHLTSLAAQIPGVSAAFATMLPLFGVIAAGEVIEKLIEKHKQLKAALAQGWADSAHAIHNQNDELQVSIEKYKELIAKLQGKPSNGVALALAEARVEADKLADSLTEDIGKLTKLMEQNAHGSLMTAILGTSGSGQAADVAKGFADAMGKVPHDSNYAANLEAVTKDAWQRAQSEIEKNNAKAAQQLKDSLAAVAAGVEPLPITDFTEANQALQQFQEKLSESYDHLELIKQEGAFKTQYEDLKKSTEAAAKWQATMDAYYKAVANSRVQLSKAVEEADKQDGKQTEERLTLELKETEDANNKQLAALKTELKQETELIQEAARHEMEMDKLTHSGEMASAQEKLKLSQITEGQMLALQRQFLDEEYQAERSALEQKLELYQNDPDKDPAALARLQNQILELDKQHANQVQAITIQSTEAQEAQWNTYFGAIENGFANTIQGIQEGNQTLTKGFQNMFNNILLSFDKMVEQMIAKWMESQLMSMFNSVGGGLFSQLGGGAGFGGGGAPVSLAPIGNSIPLHADGGRMSANELGIVGDAGPELWHPDSAGSVIPFDKLSGGKSDSRPVTVNHFAFHGVSDFDSFKQNSSQLAASMYAAMTTAARRKG
jgi:lambda family phage tail tape measure protein